MRFFEKWKWGLCFCRFLLGKGISFLVPMRRRFASWYLISERGDEACDNAFALFCHIGEKDPLRRVYYVLEASSRDREKVGKYGKILRKNSWRHVLLYFLPTTKISTHILGASPDIALFATRPGRRFLRPSGKTVFLGHGVTKEEIPGLMFSQTGVDLFVCAAVPEYQLVCEKFGYPEGAVRCLGAPRMDALFQSVPKRQILFFPTWRATLSGLSLAEFRQSAYFRAIDEFLRDARLEAFLAKNALSLVFVPHAEMRLFLPCFVTPSSHIHLATSGTDALIRESLALLTDHSSVAFDFAYARRPVIYLDWEGLSERNYQTGFYDRENAGFGQLVRDRSSLFDLLDHLVETDFSMEEPYLSRAERCFPSPDAENCARVANAVFALANRDKM